MSAAVPFMHDVIVVNDVDGCRGSGYGVFDFGSVTDKFGEILGAGRLQV